MSAFIATNLLRYHSHILSDEELKFIKESVDPKELAAEVQKRGKPFNQHEIEALMTGAGNMDDEHDFNTNGHEWSDDVLDKYAEHVMNYKYTYNDEALKVDPTTDTRQEHIGPMAQDLEQVNPAVVQEDPKTGYKTVDTGRLALMNAGAIADLARELKELKNGR